MLQVNGANYKLYLKRLSRLAPVLSRLANLSKVIWLNQYPTVDYYDENTDTGFGHNTDIFSEKIHRYNEAIQCALK